MSSMHNARPLMAASIPDREGKIKNAICFFAFEHERLARRPLTHTSLYKYLAFLDYATIEKTGRPALGLLYRTKGRHPLPVVTHAKLHSLREDRFIFLPQGQGRYLVAATAEPDLSSFSPFEVSEMKSLVETSSLVDVRTRRGAGAMLIRGGSFRAALPCI